jgi:hypothetical protein
VIVKKTYHLVFFALIFISSRVKAIDRYTLIEDLVPHEKLPRILNSDDIQNIQRTDPQPLLSPIEDFDKDGFEEAAIPGIYDLPGKGNKYFLLVGSAKGDPFKSLKLFFREYPEPVFIHKAGLTGEGDPGDQAFSISFCTECDQGYDFYWNAESRTFMARPWREHIKRVKKEVIEPGVQVDSVTVDQSLKIVSALKDVNEFIKQLKKKGRELGVRVEPIKGEEKTSRVNVRIYEKKNKKEVIYEVITVDVKEGKAIKRQRGG